MTVNPYLLALREQDGTLRTARTALEARAVAEGREPTEAEALHLRHLHNEQGRVAAELDTYETEHERAGDVAALAARVAGAPPAELVGTPGPGATAYAELGGGAPVPSLMPSPAQVVEMYRAATEGGTARRWTVDQLDVHHRATLTTGTVGVGVAAVGGVSLREPRRIATSVPIPVERVLGVEGVAFPVFGAGIADIDTEGTLKQEYAAVTAGSATPQVIAVWTDYTRQSMLSMPVFEARLRGKHAALVAKREDLLLVSRLNAVSGAQVYVGTTGTTPAYSDSLLAACGLVLSSDVAAAPDIILVNPADLPLIFPASTTHGVNGSAPDSVLRLELHGAVVYPTSAVTAGTAIVAALAASSRFVVGMDPVVLVDAMSGLKTNTITSLMEEAVTLAIDEPTGVVLVDLTPPAS